MQTLASLSSYILLAVGVVALVGGLRCYFGTEHAGVFEHPAAGIATVTFLAAMLTPLALSFGSGSGGVGRLITDLFYLALLMTLYAPLLAYHATQLLARMFSPVSQPPPEPEDPLERAKAAEDRGDTVIAVERYMRLLEAEPSHVEARTRLAELLARTGKVEWSGKLIEKGLALPDVSPAARAEWRALKLRWGEGKGVEAAPRGGKPRIKGLEDSPTPRLDAHAEAVSARGDEPPVPFDEGDEEGEADEVEEDDDSPIRFP